MAIIIARRFVVTIASRANNNNRHVYKAPYAYVTEALFIMWGIRGPRILSELTYKTSNIPLNRRLTAILHGVMHGVSSCRKYRVHCTFTPVWVAII